MSDLYIVATPFHLIYSCNACGDNDYLVVVDSFSLSDHIKKMIDQKFGTRWQSVNNFYYYRENIWKIWTFSMHLGLAKDRLKKVAVCNIYTFNDVDPVTQWFQSHIQHSGRVFVVEEGIGLYRDTLKRHDMVFKVFGKLLFGKSFQNVKRIGECKFTDGIVCQEPSKLSALQMRKKIIPMQTIDFSSLSKQLGIERYYSHAWFIGQPVVEDGLLTENEYISFLCKMVQGEKLQGKLIIKPHPRENIEKYKFLMENIDVKVCLSSELPVELLVDNSFKTNIYTLYSSAVRNFGNTKNVEVKVMYKKIPKISGIPEYLFEGKGITIVEADL